ncbi:UNVERIFIED_CONTAM: hypothetical protein HDU68_010758 [Siphonaria sp. JEL0065]|nr:hypothetical protein HDU68_010758 [Siphonaria sp. JEL0065]
MATSLGCDPPASHALDAHEFLTETLAMFSADPLPSTTFEMPRHAFGALGAGVSTDPSTVRLLAAFQSFQKRLNSRYPNGFIRGSLVPSLVSAYLPRSKEAHASSNVILSQIRRLRNSTSSPPRRIRRMASGTAEIPSIAEVIELERLAILKAPSDRARLQAKHDEIVAETRRLIQQRLI